MIFKTKNSWYIRSNEYSYASDYENFTDSPENRDIQFVIWYATGERFCFLNSWQHHESKPRVECDGYQIYYRFGKPHRKDGPALIDSENGIEKYYLYGECLTKEEWERARTSCE